MGYVVLHLDKSPDNEVPMTAHIARTKIPLNAIPELTYLLSLIHISEPTRPY